MCCARREGDLHNFLGVLSKGVRVWNLGRNLIYLSFLPIHDLPCLQGDSDNFAKGPWRTRNHMVPIWNNSFASLKNHLA